MTTTLQIRIDKKTKDAAQKAFRSMGLDMTSGVKLYLTQVMHTKTIPFPVMSADYWPREKKLQVIKEAKWALKYGKSFRTAKELHDDILKED
ncbi:MAG: type II toxin-antitoxin system RelB/DinJ family antitoxin [Patescibacteria group bacterium]